MPSSSLVGGVLFFILLGVVFLLFDGTAALPSPVSVETRARLEERVARLGSAVPDRVLLLVLAAAAALTAVVLLARRDGPRPESRAGTAPGRNPVPNDPGTVSDPGPSLPHALLPTRHPHSADPPRSADT
jgi:hypothetical protein